MFAFSGRRASARLAMAVMCLVVALVAPALAGGTQTAARSVLDQALHDRDAGSWRNARVSSGTPMKRDDSFGPAKFFTISAVLDRGSAAARHAIASLDTGTVSDAISQTPLTDITAEPYGLRLFRAPEGMAWAKWRAIENDMRVDNAAIEACRSDTETCTLEASRLVALADRARLKNGRERLTIVNTAINGVIRYQSDIAHHNTVDLWSSPTATLKSGRGDCEDYAFAKYLTLRQAGIPDADIKVLLVRDTVSAQDHAVVVARDAGQWLVLDNRWSEIVDTDQASRLIPRYSLGKDGVKLFAARFASVTPEEGEFDMLPASSENEPDAIMWRSFAY